MISIVDILTYAKIQFRHKGFSESIAEELAGEVQLYLLNRISERDGYIAIDEAVTKSEIYYAILRIIERNKQVREHNNIVQDKDVTTDRDDGESVDALEFALESQVGKHFLALGKDGCDLMNEAIFDKNKSEPEKLDILDLFIRCFGEKYKILLELYVKWLNDGNTFSQTTLAEFLGITLPGVNGKLRCLTQKDVEKLIFSTRKVVDD